ncbi:MAG: MBL fold metallo-hydrolase [Oceanospirillaceae bacterium]|nr:MBL fold metallo-hydrolase [Oceanospirillaceae bacterium]
MIFKWLNAKQLTDNTRSESSSHYHNGKFQNLQQHARKGKWASINYFKRLLFERNLNSKPKVALPVEGIDKAALALLDAQNIHLIRLGHSSMLLKMGSGYWLIDPVFSKRASPFRFIGPKRFHAPPINIEQLPEIEGVIISHNHYDHLDKRSIKALIDKTKHFYVPLGVDGDLINWGVKAEKVSTFDWWQHQDIGAVALHFTPAHHYSGRGPDDNCSTLWGSWVIQFKQQSVFFSGDSGYFAGFKEIGAKLGPFDICLIENGAYDQQWPLVHMQPHESLQAFIDLDGRSLMPIHNGTFNLAFHPWQQPMTRLSKLAGASNIDILLPKFGQVVTIGQPLADTKWWRQDL